MRIRGASADLDGPGWHRTGRGVVASTSPRVLLLRSCRPEVFARAVADLQGALPGARLTALSHPGHRDALLATGVDEVVEVEGRRFGPLRTSRRVTSRLRDQYDLVVVPQMSDDDVSYVGVHALAYVLRSARLATYSPDSGLRVRDRAAWRRGLARGAWRAPLRWLETPALLALMALACARRAVFGSVPARTAGPRPKVLHVITTWGVGGAQVQLASLAARSAERGWDVEVFVLGRSDGAFSSRHLLGTPIPIRYATAFPHLADTVLELRALCRRERYDVVHTWLFLGNVVGATAARLAGTPHVVSGVRNLSLWKRHWYARWWFRLADVLAARLCDVLTVNATALRDDHARWARVPARRIHVVPNGLSPAACAEDQRAARASLRAELGVAPDARIVGTVGRLAPEKDHETFLRVVAGLHRTGRAVTAVVVGDGERRSALEALACELGIRDWVRFLGTRADARQLMAGFDVFLLTSRIEGMANVLIEAALLGVAAVATEVGGAADVLVERDSLFGAGDVEAGISAVARLLDHPDVAVATAEATRAHARVELTDTRSVGRWWALYPPSLSAGPGVHA